MLKTALIPHALKETLPYAKALLSDHEAKNDEYISLSRFIKNSELSVAKTEGGSGYMAPVAVQESRENQFAKKPTTKQIKESFNSLVESLPDRDIYVSTAPPVSVAKVLQAFTKIMFQPKNSNFLLQGFVKRSSMLENGKGQLCNACAEA